MIFLTPRGCNRTWRRILKGSDYTAPGEPTAKLCGKPLNIDVTNLEKAKRILKWSKHTPPGDPTAKLCGKPLNIDLTNVEKAKREETTISPKVSSKCAVKFNKHSYTEDVHTR